MKMEEKHICRLCFTSDIELDKIGEIMVELLEVLLLEVDLKVSENPTICQNCKAIIERSFYFKSICIHTEKLVTAFAVNKEDSKFEFMDIFTENGDTKMISEKYFTCRFCMNRLEKNVSVSIGILMEETLYKAMLPVFMPEMDFSMVQNSVICVKCKQHLEIYFTFLSNYSDVQNKIHTFRQGRDSKGQIKVSDILRNGDLDGSNNCSQTHVDKTNSTTSQEVGNAYYLELTKIEGALDIKNEEVVLSETLEHAQSKTICSETILFYHNESKCVKNQSKPAESHTQVQSQNGKVENVIKHKCTLCSYTAKCKRSVIRHMRTHKDVAQGITYQCSRCPYKTMWKEHLKTHVLIHMDASQVEMYKCSRCPYESKKKSHLKRHMIVHRDVSEIEMYKCKLCTYMTKYKRCLEQHSLTHRDASEVEMYKCSYCPYMTKWRSHLNRHAIAHKDTSEIEMHKCTLCDSQFIYKRYLQRHILTHIDASEREKYKCPTCDFETKEKYYIKRHMRTHKDTSELEMHKCTLCTFETKHKYSLKKHAETHKDVSKEEIYKCDLCTFQTKQKTCFKVHYLTHKEGFDVNTYMCSTCSYQAERKNPPEQNNASHNTTSAIKTYKCPICCFQTRYRSTIKRHTLTHKKASELDMYKCAVCLLETKYKYSLTKHMGTHARKNASKVKSNNGATKGAKNIGAGEDHV